MNSTIKNIHSIAIFAILSAFVCSCSYKSKISEDDKYHYYKVTDLKLVSESRVVTVRKEPVSDPRDPGYGGDPSKKPADEPYFAMEYPKHYHRESARRLSAGSKATQGRSGSWRQPRDRRSRRRVTPTP